MRPDRVPSRRVKLLPWYFPVRNKRPSRFQILKRVLVDQDDDYEPIDYLKFWQDALANDEIRIFNPVTGEYSKP